MKIHLHYELKIKLLLYDIIFVKIHEVVKYLWVDFKFT